MPIHTAQGGVVPQIPEQLAGYDERIVTDLAAACEKVPNQLAHLAAQSR